MGQLTEKQQRFVDAYLIEPNATKAAIAAGYSEHTATDIGCQNLAKLDIKKALSDARVIRSEKTMIDAEWLLTRLADEAKADIMDIHDDAGNVLPMKDWPLIWRQGLVSAVNVKNGPDGSSITEIKVSDRIKRLELIGKHVDVRAFLDKVIVNEKPEQDQISDMETARRVAFILTNAQEQQLH